MGVSVGDALGPVCLPSLAAGLHDSVWSLTARSSPEEAEDLLLVEVEYRQVPCRSPDCAQDTTKIDGCRPRKWDRAECLRYRVLSVITW